MLIPVIQAVKLPAGETAGSPSGTTNLRHWSTSSGDQVMTVAGGKQEIACNESCPLTLVLLKMLPGPQARQR